VLHFIEIRDQIFSREYNYARVEPDPNRSGLNQGCFPGGTIEKGGNDAFQFMQAFVSSALITTTKNP